MPAQLPERWEAGSEFHFRSWPPPKCPNEHPWKTRGQLYGSGRDALVSLLKYGVVELKWQRLWIPSFFCQEVAQILISTRIEVLAYHANPLRLDDGFEEAKQLRSNDVVLTLNFFGLQRRLMRPETDHNQVVIIEDHTHDPWSQCSWQSDADWCVASLRKTLPIPDGGVLWSPKEHLMPSLPAVSAMRSLASMKKFVAMALKHLYLEGHRVTKEVFRSLAVAGESEIASGEVSAITPWSAELIDSSPISEWRELRRQNHQAISTALVTAMGVRVIQPEAETGGVPFAAFLVFDTAKRQAFVRQNLIVSGVYPAVHWPLENPTVTGIPEGDVELSSRVLTLHCDFRYGPHDIARIAELVVAMSRIVT